MKIHAMALLLALGLDLFFGDIERLPHPARWMGSLYRWFDEFFRKANWRRYETGLFAVLFTGAVFALGSALILTMIREGWPQVLVEGFLFYWCLSVRTLADEAKEIYLALLRKDLTKARRRLSRVVGRDTQGLSTMEVSRAVVETIGESFVDGFFTPFFWGLIFGPPGAFFFKAVSTGDSMIGHPDPPYEKFGWGAARLDDAMNFLPARLCALFLAPAALICRLDAWGLLKVFWKDRLKHASPNAAHGEAAFAGALGVKLGGVNRYGGKAYPQAFLNVEGRSCQPADILRSISLLRTAGLFIGTVLLAGIILLP
jgi:adenosylcobinamide-phosphate synthase